MGRHTAWHPAESTRQKALGTKHEQQPPPHLRQHRCHDLLVLGPAVAVALQRGTARAPLALERRQRLELAALLAEALAQAVLEHRPDLQMVMGDEGGDEGVGVQQPGFGGLALRAQAVLEHQSDRFKRACRQRWR